MFKTGCQKHFVKLHKMKNTQSEIKQIKIGKRPETTSNQLRFLKQKHNNKK